MQFSAVLSTIVFIPLAFQPAPAGQEPPGRESMGLPPRASAAEYPSQGHAGKITIGADFVGHNAPTPDATYTTEDYVAVEVGLFGPAGEKLNLSYGDFSIRVNSKKTTTPREPYELVFKNLKDPEWEPPTEQKSKTSIGSSSGGTKGDNGPVVPPKMPLELRRVMEQRVQKASLAEGERPLPQAGLLFFQYRGKITSIRSIELIYEGPAGKATIELHPN